MVLDVKAKQEFIKPLSYMPPKGISRIKFLGSDTAVLNTIEGEKYCALFTFIYPFRYTYEFFAPIFSSILAGA